MTTSCSITTRKKVAGAVAGAVYRDTFRMSERRPICLAKEGLCCLMPMESLRSSHELPAHWPPCLKHLRADCPVARRLCHRRAVGACGFRTILPRPVDRCRRQPRRRGSHLRYQRIHLQLLGGGFRQPDIFRAEWRVGGGLHVQEQWYCQLRRRPGDRQQPDLCRLDQPDHVQEPGLAG